MSPEIEHLVNTVLPILFTKKIEWTTIELLGEPLCKRYDYHTIRKAVEIYKTYYPTKV